MSAAVHSRISLLLPFGGDAHLADDALRALSARMQKNFSEEEYEILAIEWDSPDPLGEERAAEHGANVRYLRHPDAIDALGGARLALTHARNPFIGLISGAIPFLTPRLLEHAALASKVDQDPLVVVPSYRLFPNRRDGLWGTPLDPDADPDGIAGASNASQGYRPFQFAGFATSFEHGFLSPFDEVNCLFVRRETLESALENGSAEGASLFGRLAARPQAKLVVLAGEGAFITAADTVARGRLSASKLPVPIREPLVLGVIQGDAQRLLHRAATAAAVFHATATQRGEPPYPMDS